MIVKQTRRFLIKALISFTETAISEVKHSLYNYRILESPSSSTAKANSVCAVRMRINDKLFSAFLHSRDTYIYVAERTGQKGK